MVFTMRSAYQYTNAEQLLYFYQLDDLVSFHLIVHFVKENKIQGEKDMKRNVDLKAQYPSKQTDSSVCDFFLYSTVR